MTDYPKVQSYVSTHTAAYNFNCCTDWPNGMFKTFALGPPAASVFDFKTGAELFYANLNVSIPEAVCGDAQGNFYSTIDESNYTGLVKFGPNLVELERWGNPQSFPPNPPGTAIALPGEMTVVALGANQWIITIGLEHPVPNGPKISGVYLGDTILWAGIDFNTSSVQGLICTGPETATTTTAYSITGPGDSAVTQQLNVYSTVISSGAEGYSGTLPNSFVTNSLIGTIQPTAIDPAWVHIKPNGIIYDPTDGNIIIETNTDSPADNEAYIVKLKASDLTVLWKVPIPHMTSDGSTMGRGRITKGFYAYYSWGTAPVAVYVINTKDGTFTTITEGLDGLTVTGAQLSDDENGCVVAFGHFDKQATNSPIPLNDTPDSFVGWYALYVSFGNSVAYTGVRFLRGHVV